jgi:16S rRNA (cytosine967-C5)-methyltransferase
VARSIAARVLTRVWEDGAFAAAALDAEIRQSPRLDPRDIGLATELVYGVLRTEGALLARIAELAPGKRAIKNPFVRAHLLMATYSLCFLDRIPPFAATSEAVSAIRGVAGEEVAGFANAVLRNMATAIEKQGRPSPSAAIVESVPGWLRGALRKSLGRSAATAYLVASTAAGEAEGDPGSFLPPPIGLCLARGEDRAVWLRRLRNARPKAVIEPGRACPRAILVRGGGEVRRLPGAGQSFIVQEEGAQLVALALGARPGDRVLDACAGRGNKAWVLGQEVARGDSGTAKYIGGAVDAADLYPAKLERLRSTVTGSWVRHVFVVDWTAGTGAVPADYDRVLVDAPCSGVGTLRRRPEIAGRREESDIARLAELQVAIVRSAATRVRDGGRLVYAVCSVLREEAEDVVERLTATAGPGQDAEEVIRLEAVPFDSELVRTLAGAEVCSLRLLPHVHGTDGYFLASFVVHREPAQARIAEESGADSSEQSDA